MDWDVLYDGFRDEFDFCVLCVRGDEPPLSAQAFIFENPVPMLLVEDDLPDALFSALGIRRERLAGRPVLIATPAFDAPVYVELRDAADPVGEKDDAKAVLLGVPRTSGEEQSAPGDGGEEGDPSWVCRELVIGKLREAPCLIWDASIVEAAGERVMRFRATLRTDDAEAAKALEGEPLMFRQIDERGRKLALPFTILEDAMSAQDGTWTRTLTVSVRVPEERRIFVLWVWSRTLAAGSFRGFPRWIIDSIERESRSTMTSVEHDPSYDAWVKARQAEPEPPAEPLAARPHLSVLVAEEPLGWTGPEPPKGSVIDELTPAPFVRAARNRELEEARARTRASLDAQSYEDFDVRYVAAGECLGDAVPLDDLSWNVVIGLGDVLEPRALELLAREAADPAATLVYADEDVASWDGGEPLYHRARLKPRFSEDELYFGHGIGLPMAIAGRAWQDGAPGAYDLALHALEAGGVEGVRHVEDVLLHAALDRPFATEEAVDALTAHLGRRGLATDVTYRETNPWDDPERHPGGVLRVRYLWPGDAPMVSIIIPNRDHADYLGPCVASILELTTWPAFEVVIVENGSTDADILSLYAKLQEDPRVRVVAWHGGGFNYPAIVNRGAEKASGSLLCLLNNDTQVLDGDWMAELAGPLTRPEVGITGALLTFADGLVQHAGMMAVPDGGLAHQQQNLWPGALAHGGADGAEGYLMTLQRPVAYSMATGACQMVRRDVWDELGGYDEALAVGYNDADFCLRAAEAGYRTLFVPYARLHHREFGTRHRESGDAAERERWEEERRLMLERHPQVFGRDPYLNRMLDPDSRYFQLKRVRWRYETENWLGWPI